MDQNKRTDDKRPQQVTGGQYDTDRAQGDQGGYTGGQGQPGTGQSREARTGESAQSGQPGMGQSDQTGGMTPRKPFEDSDTVDPEVPTPSDGQ